MITIHQQPAEVNYSVSLPDIIVSSTDAKIVVELFFEDVQVLVESYDQPPVGNVSLKFSSVVDLLLKPVLTDFNNMVSLHQSTVGNFRVEVRDTNGFKNIVFKAIKGFAWPQPFDVSGFLRDSWLNLVPQISTVYYHQPLYLTAYPSADVDVYVKAVMRDGSRKTLKLAAFAANMLQSVNLNPGQMIDFLGGGYQFFDVYTQQGNTIRNGYKRFVYSDRFIFHADTFFYANRLGGWDTLVLTGERTINHKNTVTAAIIADLEIDINQSPKVEISKNSGFINSEEHRRQCVDFLNSTERYHFHQGSMKRILLTDPELETKHGALNSFDFKFRYSDHKLAHPEIGISPYHLNL